MQISFSSSIEELRVGVLDFVNSLLQGAAWESLESPFEVALHAQGFVVAIVAFLDQPCATALVWDHAESVPVGVLVQGTHVILLFGGNLVAATRGFDHTFDVVFLETVEYSKGS